jgi:methanogenic corrinoid protein MtbC1
MNETAKQAGRVVASTAKAVANWTVARQAELDPSLEKRYGTRWRDDWVGHVTSQMRFLAQAIAVRRPKAFADSVQWTWAAFRARGVRDSDLVGSLRCMDEVIKAEFPETVAATASEYIEQAIEWIGAERPIDAQPTAVVGPHRRLTLQYLEALLDGRRADAEQVVLNAVDEGLDVHDVYEHVLQPAQIELGRMWHAGEVTVADEHFASATTQAIMSILRTRFPKREKNGKLVVAAAVGGELHEIGVRMVADSFEMDGWDVIYLGANTPSVDIVSVVGEREADLLAVSASTLLHVGPVGELIEQVRDDESCAKTKVLVGGPPFKSVPDLWSELGADGSAMSATEAVKLGNSLVRRES